MRQNKTQQREQRQRRAYEAAPKVGDYQHHYEAFVYLTDSAAALSCAGDRPAQGDGVR
jgi:hypothetical protein